MPWKFWLHSKLPSSYLKLLITASHRGKTKLCCIFLRSKLSFSVNFRLENLHHRYRRKAKDESWFLRETADLDVGLLGLNDSTVGGGRRLYSTI